MRPTKEHIPSKGIFLEPLPNNLITVKACQECNNGSSDYDRDFQILLGMNFANSNNPMHKRFFQEKLLGKLLKKNLKRHIEIVRRMEPLNNGSYLIKWSEHDNIAYDYVIEKAIRGLYFYHFKEFLEYLKIEIHFYQPQVELTQVFSKFPIQNEIEQILQYGFWRENNQILWYGIFYETFWCGASIQLKCEKY